MCVVTAGFPVRGVARGGLWLGCRLEACGTVFGHWQQFFEGDVAAEVFVVDEEYAAHAAAGVFGFAGVAAWGFLHARGAVGKENGSAEWGFGDLEAAGAGE